MTDIKELLRQAGASSAPEPSAPPIAAIQRRARIRQSAAVVSTAAVIALVVVLLAVTLPSGSQSTTGPISSGSPSPTASNSGATMSWLPGVPAYGVAHGFGQIWAGTGKRVSELDPDTGSVIGQLNLTGYARDVTTGAGAVWVLSSNGGPTVTLSSCIPRGNRSCVNLTLPTSYRVRNFVGAAFFHGLLLIPLPTINRVLYVAPRRGIKEPLQAFSIHVGSSPSSMATTGNGQLWVESHGSTVLRRVVRTGISRGYGEPVFGLGPAISWKQPILAAAPGNGMWSTEGQRLIDIAPHLKRGGSWVAQVARLQTDGEPLAVRDASNGVYVATREGLDFFASDDLDNGDMPTAFYRDPINTKGGGVAYFTADGDSVVFAQSGGMLIHWTPPSQWTVPMTGQADRPSQT